MSDEAREALEAKLQAAVGQPMGAPSEAPDEVNLPMIRHWVDALDDRNPIYLDAEHAAATRHKALVAPPTMLQAWTMPRPQIEGIAERGGSSGAINPDNPISVLASAGYTGTVATNSDLAFERYLHLGDRLTASAVLESVSERKATPLGFGYFVTWINIWRDQKGEEVGNQVFRVLKFDPGSAAEAAAEQKPREKKPKDAPSGEVLPPWSLDVTSTVIVAGAIASRDYMPVHHDADYARAQGAPHMFMNILTTNGYVARYITDWAGPEAVLREMKIRLGAPAVPGQPLRFTGQVISEREEGGEKHLEVSIAAANDFGNHATGTVSLTRPA